jgi:hypothetical protein
VTSARREPGFVAAHLCTLVSESPEVVRECSAAARVSAASRSGSKISTPRPKRPDSWNPASRTTRQVKNSSDRRFVTCISVPIGRSSEQMRRAPPSLTLSVQPAVNARPRRRAGRAAGRTAASRRPERAHEGMLSGQNARLRDQFQRARPPWALCARASGNSHCAPTVEAISRFSWESPYEDDNQKQGSSAPAAPEREGQIVVAAAKSPSA